jgi:putative Mg2+ transporter-C (MgtC) family protein
MVAESVDHAMFDLSEIVLRLTVATLVGAGIGLNRDLHGKPTGLRTLGLVSLGAAAMTLAVTDASAQPGDPNPLSRVMQGVLTGVGFLGAGVILHPDNIRRVSGLTTAACVWLTACIGMVCGAGNWKIFGVMLPLVLIVLLVGGRLEKTIHRRWDHSHKPEDVPGAAVPTAPPHNTS